MKNLKQILGLYLGQKLINNEGSTLEITGVNKYEDNPLTIETGIGFDVSESKIGRSIFLLLRPLSSMTDAEAKGLADSVGCDLHDFMTMFGDDSEATIWLKNGEDVQEFGLLDNGNVRVDNVAISAPIHFVLHLSSLGFDCFNLIGQGIAKDINGL